MVMNRGGGGVIILQVWIGMTVRSLNRPNLFQSNKKFLGVILLVRGGGYFRGHANGINGRAGFRSSGVGLVCERVTGVFLMPLRWSGRSMGKGVDRGYYGGPLLSEPCLR